jgi:hypothetical protein
MNLFPPTEKRMPGPPPAQRTHAPEPGYAYVVFLSREDRGKALLALAKRGRVYSFRGAIYELTPDQLRFVDELGLSYREATPSEVETARGSVHDSAAAVL